MRGFEFHLYTFVNFYWSHGTFDYKYQSTIKCDNSSIKLCYKTVHREWPKGLKSSSSSSSLDGGVNPGSPAGPTRTKGSPAVSLGLEWNGPPSRAESRLRSYASRSESPTSRDTWWPTNLAPRVRAMPVTRDVRSKNAAPPDRRAGKDRPQASSRMTALLILRQGLRQLDSLTRGQRRSRGPLDTMGGGIRRCCLPSP